MAVATHLVVISEKLAVSSNQHLRVLHTIIALRVLRKVVDASGDHDAKLLCELSQAEGILVLRQRLGEVARLICRSSNVVRCFRQEACLLSALRPLPRTYLRTRSDGFADDLVRPCEVVLDVVCGAELDDSDLGHSGRRCSEASCEGGEGPRK